MFFELAEEKFREYCLNGKGDLVMRNLWNSMDIDNFTEDLCEVTITKIKNETQDFICPYAVFKYSIRSELTTKYYERRIRNVAIDYDTELGDSHRNTRYPKTKQKSILDYPSN